MFFYSKMRWKIDGMTFDQLWDLEGEECKAAVKSIEDGIVSHLYKVGAEQYVISVGQAKSMEEFDLYAMGYLPMREHLIFEEVWPLDEGFTIDVAEYLKKRRDTQASDPNFLFYVQLAWDQNQRFVDTAWDEITAGLKTFDAGKVLGVYRVAGQERIIAILDVKTAADINSFSSLSVLNNPEVEKVWSLRDYIGFAHDVWNHYK